MLRSGGISGRTVTLYAGSPDRSWGHAGWNRFDLSETVNSRSLEPPVAQHFPKCQELYPRFGDAGHFGSQALAVNLSGLPRLREVKSSRTISPAIKAVSRSKTSRSSLTIPIVSNTIAYS